LVGVNARKDCDIKKLVEWDLRVIFT